jgi:hypothetical protein
MSELLCRRTGGLLHETKPPAHIGAFSLADYNIEVPFLVFRSTSYVRTIQENGQWEGRRDCIRVSKSPIQNYLSINNPLRDGV